MDRLHAHTVGRYSTVAGAVDDAVDARDLDGFGERHRREDGGEPPCQHRLVRPGGAEQEHIMGRTPAYHFALPRSLGMPMDPLLNLLVKLSNQYEAIL